MSHDATTPSEWVTRWAHLARPGGRVLDLACGSGRHARYFAARGFDVVACDRDPAAIASLAGVMGVTAVQVDLEDGSPWPFRPAEFDAIVVCNYLHRPLFVPIAESLAAGGVLLYETFLAGNERYGKPSNPRFLLDRDELLEAFGRRLVVAGYEQGRLERAKPGSMERDNPALIQRICAVQTTGTDNKLEP